MAIRMLLAVLGGLAVAGNGWADKPAAPAIDDGDLVVQADRSGQGGGSGEPAASETAVAAWVAQLGSDHYADRRQAFLQLWASGQGAVPALQAAKASSGRLVAEAANVLLILIELEIGPQRSAESTRLLEAIGDPKPTTIVELCRLRYWAVAERMLEANPGLAAQFQDSYGRSLLGKVVDAAVEQSQLEAAWSILRRVASPAQAAWISYKTGLPAERDDAYSTAQRLFYAGEHEEALKIELPQVARLPMLTRWGRWPQMRDAAVVDLLAGRQASPSQQAVLAVLSEVSGDYSAAQQLWDELLPPTASPATAESATENAAPPAAPLHSSPAAAAGQASRGPRLDEQQVQAAVELLEKIEAGGFGGQANRNQLLAALLYSGRVAAVEQYLQRHDPDTAFSFYLAGNNVAAALEVIGLQPDLSNFEAWFAQRKQLISGQLGQRGLEHNDFEQCARLCGQLADLGYRTLAEQMLQGLVELARLSRGQQTELWSRSLLPWLSRSETRHLALQAAQREFPRMSSECQAAVLRGLFPEFKDVAYALWQTAPHDDAARKWDDLQRLYVWDRAAFGNEPQRSVEQWLRRALGQLKNEQQLAPEPLRVLADVAQGFGISELALEVLLTDLSQNPGAAAVPNLHWTQAADLLVQLGRPEEALPLLENLRDSGVTPQRAYLTEIQALMLSGKFTQATVLDRARWMRPMGTVTRYPGDNYYMEARELANVQQYPQAAELAEAAFLLADVGSIDLYWAAGIYGEILEELDDHLRQADVLRAAWIEALQPFASSVQTLLAANFHSSLRYSAQKEKLAWARACVQRQDWSGYEQALKAARSLQPQDIEVVCQCYPLLREQGQLPRAESLFRDYEAEMERQIEHWPQDATALNNLAWMYAQCDQKLDRARQLAEQAVALAPGSAIFLDTLAEVEFRSGNRNDALRLMSDCIRLDPRQQHYRENLVRFRQQP